MERCYNRLPPHLSHINWYYSKVMWASLCPSHRQLDCLFHGFSHYQQDRTGSPALLALCEVNTTDNSWIPLTKEQWYRKRFHGITWSWYPCKCYLYDISLFTLRGPDGMDGTLQTTFLHISSRKKMIVCLIWDYYIVVYNSLRFNSKFAHMCPIINNSIFDLVMAWCRQATSHYRIQCLSTSPTPNGNVTTPQRVNVLFYGIQSGFGRNQILQWFDAWFATNLSSIPIMNESSS